MRLNRSSKPGTVHSPANPVRFSVVGGVDTHRDTHVGAVADTAGRLLGSTQFRADPTGYAQLVAWMESWGRISRVGVEGTGSYGAGLARHLIGAGIGVVEVNRPNRQLRRQRGKDDNVDAEAAARAAACGEATAVPKSGDGPVEWIRMLTVVRRSAVKARTQAANQFHSLLVGAPEPLKAQLSDMKLKAQVRVCARFRPSGESSVSYAKSALRRLARRYQTLNAEIAEHDAEIKRLCARANPALLAHRRCRTQHSCNAANRRRRQPPADEIGTILCCAVWCQPRPSVVWANSSASSQPGRQPASQQRTLADALPTGCAPTPPPKNMWPNDRPRARSEKRSSDA